MRWGRAGARGQAQALDRIRQDALRAGHVLNQLLALARASRAELDGATASVDLAALARNACAEYAQAAWQRATSWKSARQTRSWCEAIRCCWICCCAT